MEIKSNKPVKKGKGSKVKARIFEELVETVTYIAGGGAGGKCGGSFLERPGSSSVY
ncbi:unnamed protein product [Malus baccata var. baccata]